MCKCNTDTYLIRSKPAQVCRFRDQRDTQGLRDKMYMNTLVHMFCLSLSGTVIQGADGNLQMALY